MSAERRQTFYVSDEDQRLIEMIKRDAEREDRSISYIILRILKGHYEFDKGKQK